MAQANREAERRISEHAHHVGLGRRAFLQSLCGAATTLLTLNDAFAAVSNTGGLFRMLKESAFDTAAAAEALAGDEFIFDVQTHMVDPAGAWRSSAGKYWEQILANFPQAKCGDNDPVDCFSAEKFIKHVFMDSDTELAVLSFVPELPENPLSLEEAIESELPERRRKTEADHGRRKQAYLESADPTYETYGPKTDLEYADRRAGRPSSLSFLARLTVNDCQRRLPVWVIS
jgi:hypothetical protein